MAALTPGQNGTISATTAEGAAFQLFQWWQIQEASNEINPLDQQFFSGTKDTDTNIFEGKWKLQVSVSSAGVLSATPIYQGLNFSTGTGGAISGTTAEAYTLELMLWMINKQKDTNSSNPEKIINITGTINLNEGIIEGDYKIPFTSALSSNGGVQDIAREYLL